MNYSEEQKIARDIGQKVRDAADRTKQAFKQVAEQIQSETIELLNTFKRLESSDIYVISEDVLDSRIEKQHLDYSDHSSDNQSIMNVNAECDGELQFRWEHSNIGSNGTVTIGLFNADNYIGDNSVPEKRWTIPLCRNKNSEYGQYCINFSVQSGQSYMIMVRVIGYDSDVKNRYLYGKKINSICQR